MILCGMQALQEVVSACSLRAQARSAWAGQRWDMALMSLEASERENSFEGSA